MKETKILFVGQSFGKTEEKHGVGFTGSSGTELSFMLRDAGLTHQHILFCPNCKEWDEYPACKTCKESLYPSAEDMIRYWSEVEEEYNYQFTNVFPLYPPNNDLSFIFKPIKNSFMPGLKFDPKKPLGYIQPEFHHHLENLWQNIRETNPNLIVPLGNVAMWATLRQSKITEFRGYITSSQYLPNQKFLCTFNPNNILNDWSSRPIVLSDFKKAQRESLFPEIRRTRRKVTLYSNLDEIRNWLNQPADNYTIDIESGYALFTPPEIQNMPQQLKYLLSSQISMIGFASSPTNSIVIEFMTRNKPNLNYWESEEEEVEAWNLVQLGLNKSIPKTFQNGVYDVTRLLYAGITTNMAKHDTMLLHHSLLPEMKKGLGFLGSIYANEQPWKLMYSKGEELKKDS